ncbi:MAG: hypothetical protein AMXMBFR84_16590 [Candidatus Hydrogenedentota bacterium]
MAQYVAAGYRVPVPADEITITELCAAYWTFAKGYYHSEGERFMIHRVCEALKNHYGGEPAADFGPLKCEALLHWFVSQDLSRTGVNHCLGRIKRLLRWGVTKELVQPDTYAKVAALPGLRKGRSAAREGRTVLPPPVADVDALLADEGTTRVLRALVTVQRHSGARAGELMNLTPGHIDTAGPVWEARLTEHKTAYRGRERILFFGPECQAVLKPLMLRKADAPLFSPAESEAERRALIHSKRKTPLSCGNRPGTNRVANPETAPADRYTVDSYRRALSHACRRAKVKAFSPHQLRHLAATEIRAKYGLEAAQVMLGHAGMAITQLYAEQDFNLARRVAQAMG